MRTIGERTLVLVVATVVALAGCEQRTKAPTERKPQQAGQPMDPAKTAARLAAMRAQAMVGDQAGVQRNAEAISEDMRRAMKLPDARRPIDHEQARAAIRGVAGVRSVAWIDRSNLLVIVDDNTRRSYATVDAICLALEPLGDTLAVVVNLQSGAASNGDDLEILSRNCQLAPGDRALAQRNRQVDVIDPALRRQHKAAQSTQADKQAQDEAAKILEASTPEM